MKRFIILVVFKDGANADVEYFYDANGALVKDLNKGISNIEYDVLGNLKCITFSNGFKTKYVYDAAGNKLRTTHESAVTNTTDYVGNFVFEDGKLSKYLFDGGLLLLRSEPKSRIPLLRERPSWQYKNGCE